MDQVRRHLREAWAGSRTFRIILTVALLYAVLRLVVHGAYLGMMLYPNSGLMGGMPGWTGAEGEPMVPPDLQIYLDAAKHFRQRQDLYLKGSLDRLESHYPYAPSFALAFVPFLLLSPTAVSVVHSGLHVVAYLLLFVCWARIFGQLGLKRVNRMLARSAPAWLVFSAFWSDLGYLNIYLIMTLIGTLYIEAVINERLGWSVLWLSIILQVKPHWAFATALPLLLGRHRYFFRLVALAILAYLGIGGMMALVAGPNYTVQQYADYATFLGRLSRDFPWRGPESAFLGYNHSIRQIVFYVMGETPRAAVASTILKAMLLAPLALCSFRLLRRSSGTPPRHTPRLTLDLVFLLYLAAFIWLDMVWEASLSIALFPYLLGTVERRWLRVLAIVVFVPYALIDLWQLVSFAAFGMDVIAPGPYVLTDPSIYVPVVMIVIVAFYAFLLKRAWEAFPRRMTVGAAA